MLPFVSHLEIIPYIITWLVWPTPVMIAIILLAYSFPPWITAECPTILTSLLSLLVPSSAIVAALLTRKIFPNPLHLLVLSIESVLLPIETSVFRMPTCAFAAILFSCWVVSRNCLPIIILVIFVCEPHVCVVYVFSWAVFLLNVVQLIQVLDIAMLVYLKDGEIFLPRAINFYAMRSSLRLTLEMAFLTTLQTNSVMHGIFLDIVLVFLRNQTPILKMPCHVTVITSDNICFGATSCFVPTFAASETLLCITVERVVTIFATKNAVGHFGFVATVRSQVTVLLAVSAF